MRISVTCSIVSTSVNGDLMRVRYKQSLATIVLALGLVVDVRGDESAFLQLLRSTNDRSEFFGTRITYEFEYTEGPEESVFEGHDEAVASGKRILEIGLPIEGSVAIPFRISHHRRIIGEPLADSDDVITCWEAFDGRESRRFIRTLFFDKCAYRHQHIGNRDMGSHLMVMSRYDPVVMAIFFSSGTFSRLSGHPAYVLPDKPEINGVAEIIPDERFGKLCRWQDGESWQLFTVPPTCYQVDSSPSFEDRFSISGLKDFGGIVLPESGNYSNARLGYAAKYRITAAERFNLNPESWFPTWISGTTVIDSITGEATDNPFTADEILAIEDVTSVNCDAVDVPVTSHSKLLWVNGALASIIVVMLVVRKIRR